MSLGRRIALAALALGVLTGGAFLNRETLMLSALGARAQKRTLDEHAAMIAPFIHVFTPATGAPPFPAVVQFHGCAGYRPDFMEMWAREGTREGFIVLAVDSGAPRGIDRERSFKTVCAGKELIGQERAGDVAAALEIARARPDVDPDRIILAGWSHGGWTVMDYLALTANGRRPAGLKGALEPFDPAGVILFYPYCGEGNWSRLLSWKTRAGVLALIAGADSYVDGPQCRAMLERFAAKGADIDIAYYPDADHVFDDAGLVGGENEQYYSPMDAADARRRYAGFLAAIRGGAQSAPSQ